MLRKGGKRERKNDLRKLLIFFIDTNASGTHRKSLHSIKRLARDGFFTILVIIEMKNKREKNCEQKKASTYSAHEAIWMKLTV